MNVGAVCVYWAARLPSHKHFFFILYVRATNQQQEQIYDEQDRVERQHLTLAKKVARTWKAFVRHKKHRRNGGIVSDIDDADNDDTTSPRMMAVVEDAVATARGKSDAKAVEEGLAAAENASESTALLGFQPSRYNA